MYWNCKVLGGSLGWPVVSSATRSECPARGSNRQKAYSPWFVELAFWATSTTADFVASQFSTCYFDIYQKQVILWEPKVAPQNTEPGRSADFHCVWTRVPRLLCCRIRPYSVECTRSRSISEVKQLQARLVLGWVTAWEYRVPYPFTFLPPKISVKNQNVVFHR